MVKAVTPIPFVKARFFDRCGKPLSGGKVYTYDANTTTDKITYKDSYGLSPNTNPVILDAAGEADIYLDGTYRIRITDRNDVLVNDVSKIGAWFSGNLQDTLDNISGAIDDAIKPTLKNLEDTIATAAAAGAGANGWTDLLVQTQNGRTQAEKNADSVSVKDFGAKGDGVTDDTQAFANAALANVAVNVPKGVYVINQNIVGNFWTNDGVETKGDGCIYIKDNRKQQMLSKVVEKMYNGQPVNITCFGDSTTEGVGSSQHTKFRLESGQERTWTCSSAYPAQLQKLLQDIFNNSNIKVNNAGYAGKTLYNGWAANNIKSKVTDAFATEILIIGFGLNDVANSDFTADKYLIELKKIVGYAISRNIVPIILTPNYNANEPWRSNYKLFATVINSIIEYCKADNILCVDVHKDLQKAFSSSTKVTTAFGYVAPDTLHYNNYGYGLVASSIAANLVANVFIVDGYTKITPEMGNIYRASEATTQYYNPNLAGVGGNYVWGSTDLQVNDELYEVWFYNTIPNAVLRYHAISNDGCVNTDRLSILVLNAAADDTAIYKHIASGTPYDHGVATAVENSQILQTLDVGLYKVGLKLNTALPNSTTDGFVLSGYFSVSAQPQLSYANSAVLPKKTAPYCKSLVLDVNNDVRFGFGDNTTLLVTGLMPKDSGFIICQSPAMYSNTEIQNGRDAIHDNTQEGILIFRDVWGNTKLYRVVFINKIEQIWLYELTSISNSYTDDNIVMLVNLKKDTTNFTLSASYQKGGTGNLSYTAKHKDWNMPVGGITGSVFRGTSVNSELLVSLNYELL